jgi:hypothetical protein
MVEAFTSAGVQFFDITHTNIDQEKRGSGPGNPLPGHAAPFLPWWHPPSADETTLFCGLTAPRRSSGPA